MKTVNPLSAVLRCALAIVLVSVIGCGVTNPPPPTNETPTAAITAPADGSSVTQGDAVTFTGTGTDPEDGALTGASLVWTSSLDGQIGTGATFMTSTLSVGSHTVTLTVTDSDAATGTASITLTVVPNESPVAAITAPVDATSVNQGDAVTFAGTGSDTEDGALSGASLVWTSSLDGQIGTGETFMTSALSSGMHTVTLTATDANSATGTASITLTVVSQSPSAAITAPGDGSSVNESDAVTFAGTGTDPQDGALTGASLVWTSSLDGQIGTDVTFMTSTLSVGAHTVTLTATDADTNTGTASITLTVVNQSPVAAITAPADGSSVNEGDAVTFAGTGTDPEDGALTGASLVWTSSLDGQIGTGETFMTSTLSAGVHTVTLTATDANANTGTASITLTVVNQSPVAAISAPADASSVIQGNAVTFAGTGTDPEDGVLTGASLVWTSSLDGEIGTGATFMTSTLSVGVHTVTLTATDANANTGTASITLTVTLNQNPVASITAPADASSVIQGDAVTFAGTGTDPEDGALTGASLVWTSSLDGQIGTGVTFMTSTLSVGAHTVTLTATDANTNTGTASITLTVTPQAVTLTVTPGFAVLDVGGMTTLSVVALDAGGNPITSPPLTVVSRNGAVASAPSTAVTGVAAGVTDVVITSGLGADSARIAVVDASGFAALLSTTTDDVVIEAAPGSTVTLDLRVIRPPSGTGDLGSIQGSLQWDPAQLTYQSSAVVETGWSWFPNETNVGTGQLDFSAFSPTGTAAMFSVAQVVFTVAGASGGSSGLNLAITVAGDGPGTDISALVQSVLSSVEIQ